MGVVTMLVIVLITVMFAMTVAVAKYMHTDHNQQNDNQKSIVNQPLHNVIPVL